MAKQLRIVPEKCTACLQCELACSFVQTGAFQPSRSLIRVHVFEDQASYGPYACLQCDEAWCMTACPVNAIQISGVGAKAVVEETCVGCGLCVVACPFGTIWLEPATHKAVKCDLCAGEPACAAACPTRAIEVVDAEPTGPWLEAWGADLDRGRAAIEAGEPAEQRP